MRTLSMESNELKHIIETKIRHPYVEKYIKKPFIDDDKLFILNYFYKDSHISSSKKQQYITTVMLVQIALDTHELVPSNQAKKMSEREKQLSVLVGDYYSGLYYYLLAQLEDVEMIQLLATAIKYINEQKMILFYENVHTVEEFFTVLQRIESLLFTQVANYLNVDKNIVPIIQELLIINRLLKEKELLQQNKFSYVEKYVENTVPNATYTIIIQIIENELERRFEYIDELLVRLPYHFVVFKHMIRNKIKLTYNTTVAEEG